MGNTGSGPKIEDEVEGDVDSLANRYFASSSSFPVPLMVLPLMYLSREMVWTDEIVLAGRLFISLEAILCFAVSLFVKSGITSHPKRDVAYWFPSQEYKPEVFKLPSPDPPPYVSLAMKDFEMSLLWEAQRQVLLGLVVAWLVPYLFGVNQPILLQSILIPVTFFRQKVFRKHALNVTYRNPYKAVTEKEAKAANKKHADELSKKQKESEREAAQADKKAQ